MKTRFKGGTMKDLIAVTIAGILLWWVAVFPIEDVRAEPNLTTEEIKEFSMKTETGEVVLTKEPCEFIKMGLKGYPYAAYATDKGHANHEGCWTMDVIDRFKAVKVYFPEIDATAVYNPALFEPRLPKDTKDKEKPIKGTVQLENNTVMLYEVFTF